MFLSDVRTEVMSLSTDARKMAQVLVGVTVVALGIALVALVVAAKK